MVYDYIDVHGGYVTLKAMQEDIKITRPELTKALDDLKGSGLVGMKLKKPSGRGRPTHLYYVMEKK